MMDEHIIEECPICEDDLVYYTEWIDVSEPEGYGEWLWEGFWCDNCLLTFDIDLDIVG